MTRLELFDPALLEHVPEQRAHNQAIMEATAAMADLDAASPEGLAWVRAAMAPGGLFGMTAYDFPEVREIPGPAGPVPVRVLVPEQVDGVYLHLHGGAMTVGSAASMDPRNWDLARASNVAVVSVDYRLAPEQPFPAGPDDCEAAARWLVEHAADELGTDRLLIGGESAGAYLALLTLLRLRDGGAVPSPFLGADLCYGGYDLTGTPSRRLLAGKVPYATGDDGNRRLYLGDRTDEECRDPAISPLWADLHDLPPCLVTVGTADWLLDDNLFLASRLAAAGNAVELAVWPEGPHGIEGAPTTMGRLARERIHGFLRGCLAGARAGA
jgi:acetyl esterase/lipase